jgi:hypothetical protein
MTRALLLLTGGRGVPDMLMVNYLKPDKIFNITTTQGMKNALDFQQFSRKHFHRDVDILPTINPFDETEIKMACKTALELAPDAEWIIHFTGSPKVVGIYAHDIARDHNIPFCFLDTEGKQLISLVKDLPINPEIFFKASVQEYIGAYGRTYEIPKLQLYRSKAESWYNIAQILVNMPEETQNLLKGVRSPAKGKPLEITVDSSAQPLLEELSLSGIMAITSQADDKTQCQLLSHEIREFLEGDWLEVYVWQEARNAGFADDCQWGYKIVVDQKMAATLPSNELDLALTYNARLLIAECKTSANPFDSLFLNKLYSIANLVGGGYVNQVFITNIWSTHLNAQKRESFDNFQRQADVRRIRIITGEQLPEVGKLLRQQIATSFRSF